MTAGPAPASIAHELSWTAVLAAARPATRPRPEGLRDRDPPRRSHRLQLDGHPRKDTRALVFETLAIGDKCHSYLDAAVLPVERVAVLDLLERRVIRPTPVPYLLGETFFAGHRLR